MAQPRPTFRAPLGVGLLAVALSCGGNNVDAPYNAPNTGENTGRCGTLAEAKATLKASATRADFIPLGEILREELIARGKFRQLVRVGLALLRQAPPTGLSDALRGLQQGEGLAKLTPHMAAVMAYFVGSTNLPLAPDEQFAAGEHLGPVQVVADSMRICQPQTAMELLHRLLSVRVPCESCPSGNRLFLASLTDAISVVVLDPELGGILETLEFSDTSSNETAIGRRAFALFLDLLMEGLSSTSFNLEYFDQNLRVQVDDVIGRRLNPGARANLDALMGVIRAGLDPGLGLITPLQETIRCMLRMDDNHEIASMLFDYVRLDSLEYRDFVSNIAATFETGSGSTLLTYMSNVFRILANDPQAARDVVSSVLPLLERDVARKLFRTLDGMRGKGVAHGLLEMAARFLGGCSGEAPP
ncbi:MAG: hypothetical protein AB2A00_27910 [Myxococcota bacterium]